jgi:hypothetical protein
MTRVDAYLRSLSVELRTRFINDAQIIDEVGGHLADAVEAARQQGADDDDAQRCAVAHFGAPEVIGAAFAADRTWARHRVLLVLAGFAGVAVAYVDSRPTWDDTGVTAGAMFLFAAVLGLLGPQRPWLWAAKPTDNPTLQHRSHDGLAGTRPCRQPLSHRNAGEVAYASI